MGWIDRLKVNQKLALLIGVFVVGFVLFALYATWTRILVQVNGPYHKPISQARDLLQVTGPSTLDLSGARLLVYRLLETTDPRAQETLIREGETLRKAYETAHDQWAAALPEGTLKQKLTVDAHEPAVEWFNARDQIFVPALKAGNLQAARAVAVGRMKERAMEQHDAIGQAIELARANLASENLRITQVIGMRNTQTTILGLSILGLCALFGTLLSRSLTRVLAETVGTLSTTSCQIASSIEEHERTAMSQSAAVHETTTTMDELEASFNHTAEMVQTAAGKARLSVDLAEEGRRSVQQTVAGMSELKGKVGQIAEHILGLSQQTSQIGSITTLVSDLASQTNMLALNAAVEAARAGEHGRGFAVVATEIRKLADESRKSAERINALVEEIQRETNSTVMVTEEGTKTVERSIQLAQETASAFDSVTSASTTVSEATQQTLLTVPQQVSAVKQVLSAMDSLSAGAQEAASGISQTRSGADDIRLAAQRLGAMI